MATGTRRRAREAALKILYGMDLSGHSAEQALTHYFEFFDLEAEGDEYARVIVRGVARERDRVDEAIRSASTRWRLERMARVDRNVLRIGAYELLFCEEVPPKVILDEAIELGKRFGAEESGAFVNGVLDRLAQEVRPKEHEREGASEEGASQG